MRKLPRVVLAAAALVFALGVAGLARGGIAQQPAAGPAGTPGPPITVTNAWVRQPVTPGQAAAYFTVSNTTDEPDTLQSVITGAGADAVLHTDGMQLASSSLVIPPHSSVTLKPGNGHVMIEKLYGALVKGQSVNLQLTFASAGEVLVTARVIGVLDPVPTGAS